MQKSISNPRPAQRPSFWVRIQNRLFEKKKNKGIGEDIRKERAEYRMRVIHECVRRGDSVQTVAARHKITPVTIQRWAKLADIKLPGRLERQYRHISQDVWDKVIEAYKNGRSLNSLANEYEISGTIIRRHLMKLGIFHSDRRRRETQIKLDKKQSEILNDYQSGESIDSLAVKYKVCAETMRKHLRRMGAKIRHRQIHEIFSNEAYISDIVRLRNEGYSQASLATMYHTSESNIRRLLKEYDALCEN